MSNLSSLIQSIIKKTEKTGAQAEAKALKKLPSRALDKSEQEAMEDLFKQDPSMKRMAAQEQADLYGKTSDIPEEVIKELPPVSDNPYRNPNLPVPSVERKLVPTVREVSEIAPEGSITEKIPNISQEATVVSPPVKNSYIPSKKAFATAGIAAGLGAGMLAGNGNIPPPEQPSIPETTPERVPASTPKQTEVIKKILAKAAPISKKGNPASLESIEQTPEEKASEIEQFVKDFETKENPPPPMPTELDVGTGPNALNELKSAQEARDQNILFNQLAQIAERGAAAYGGFKPLYGDIYEGNIKRAGQLVDDAKERMEQQKNDPNSPTSQAFKKYMEKFGNLKIKGDFTAAMGKELLPLEFKKYENMVAQQAKAEEAKLARETRAFEAEENRKSREHISEENRKTRLQMAKDAALAREQANALKVEEKQSQFDTKRFDELGKRLTSETASSRSAFGKASNNIRAAEAIEALGEQYKDKGQLDRRQVYELARSLDTLLSQGQGTISGAAHLIPNTYSGDVSKITEYILNIPKGARQGDFVKRTLETVNREKELAKKQIERTQGKILGPYKETLRRNPDKARDILAPHGLEFLLDENKSEETPKETQKTVVKKGYNPTTNQTQLIYSDGTKEIVPGRQ